MQQYNSKRWPGNLFLLIWRQFILVFYLNTNTQTQKSGYLLDRNVTPPGSVASFRTSPLSDYSNFHFFFFFTCFVRLLVPFLSLLLHILSLQYSSFLFLPTFHSLSILALVPALSPLLSDKLFVGRNLRHGLLSCSQVLSLTLFLCLSILQRATGKALPSPSLWVSPFPLHPDCPKNSLSLSHTKTQIQCADIHVQYATFRQNAVLNIHRHTKCI